MIATLFVADPVRYARMTTEELRDSFLISDLFKEDSVCLVYCDVDRAIVGGAIPKERPLSLPAGGALRSETFCARRELGIFNIGSPGTVRLDGVDYPLANREILYVGRGSREVLFMSDDPRRAAAFYLLSYPAHAAFPTKKAGRSEAEAVALGAAAAANRRTIYKMIHPGGIQSCQLVMGFTELEEGSVWNTMPPHTHARRMEVYLYFDLGKGDVVFHLMGPPDRTRHLVVRNREVVLSPSWSIHSGVGTRRYAFVWGMGGENQAFDDMDGIAPHEIR